MYHFSVLLGRILVQLQSFLAYREADPFSLPSLGSIFLPKKIEYSRKSVVGVLSIHHKPYKLPPSPSEPKVPRDIHQIRQPVTAT